MTAFAAERPETTVADVLRRWATHQNTADIATATGIPQADVCRIISADQDRRHAARVAGTATSHVTG